MARPFLSKVLNAGIYSGDRFLCKSTRDGGKVARHLIYIDENHTIILNDFTTETLCGRINMYDITENHLFHNSESKAFLLEIR